MNPTYQLWTVRGVVDVPNGSDHVTESYLILLSRHVLQVGRPALTLT
jgi:hypothetical protein